QCLAVRTARLAPAGKLQAGSHGKHRALLEADFQHPGGSGIPSDTREPPAGEESAGTQDGHEGLSVVGALTSSWNDSHQLHTIATHSGDAGADPAADRKS